MLHAGRRGDAAAPRPLTPDEDNALRRAFGRFGSEGARLAGAEVVRRHQQRGRWFLCDCRPGSAQPPVLVPVAESHIRRHGEAPWASHAPGCDFFLDAAEQGVLLRTYHQASALDGLRLLRRFAEDREAPPEVPGIRHRNYDRGRESLARLLTHLAVAAGLQGIAPGPPPSLSRQFKGLRQAARAVKLDGLTVLADWLCTWQPDLDLLLSRIDQAPKNAFARGRPCGLLVAIVTDYGDGSLHMAQGDPVRVRGRISVWGEQDGLSVGSVRARAPYLAACLLGQPAPGERAEVLRAYLHPCVARSHLMLVDSNLERLTLEQLRRLQHWLASKRGLKILIEKPLHDLSDPDGEAREPCIPDWLLRAEDAPAGGHSLVVVETMGSAEEDYRIRKSRTHEAMSTVVGAHHRAPVILHEFYGRLGQSQAERDDRCWTTVRRALVGSSERQ